LTTSEQGWLVPGRNPFGLYLYFEDVDGLAAALEDLRVGRRGPEDKPWGMYEFALSDRMRRSRASVGRVGSDRAREANCTIAGALAGDASE
jgi:hypothetical protein